MTVFAYPRKREREDGMLTQVDEDAREYDDEVAEEIFERKERLSNLGQGKFAADGNTIFSAILQELKNRKKK